jgi:hypothetical protein
MHIPTEILNRFGLEPVAPTVEQAPAPPKPVGCPTCLENAIQPGWCWACDGEGGFNYDCSVCGGAGSCPDCENGHE